MKIYILLLFIFLPILSFAQLKGKVIKVADGDTFTILTENKEQVKIRLFGIDCPESKQDYGNKAKQHVSDLCFGKEVYIEEKGKDRYKRTLGIAYVDTININESLLKCGLAWHYRRYYDSKEYAELEQQARKSKINIWSMKEPVAPWIHRKKK